MLRIVFIIAIIYISLPSHGQRGMIISDEIKDKEKINLLIRKAHRTRNTDVAKSISNIHQCVSILSKNGDSLHIAQMELYLARGYGELEDYENAIHHILNSIELAKKYDLKGRLANAEGLYSTLLSNMGETEKAIEEIEKTLKRNADRDKFYQPYYALSKIYLNENKKDEYHKNATKALNILRKNNQTNILINILERLSDGYLELGMDKEYSDTKEEFLYLTNNKQGRRKMKKYDITSSKPSERLYALAEEIELHKEQNNMQALQHAYFELSRTKRTSQNKALITQLLEEAKSIQFPDLDPTLRIYSVLFEIYKEEERTEEALRVGDVLLSLKDSIYTDQSERFTTRLSRQLETAKAEQEIYILNKENEIKDLKISEANRKNILLALASISLLLLSLGLFYFFRQKKHHNESLTVKNDEVAKALKEKELLLKEIHHRVKNNLQVISSLLSLQSDFIEDDSAQRAIKEGRDRVKSMALIHQSLYQENDLTGIHMESYLSKLSKSIFNSYNTDPKLITLDMDIDSMRLDVDTVIPIGLIINELVTNALKYAFPAGQQGELKISLKEKEAGIELKVEDNGIGIEPDRLDENVSSFGYQMIHIFKEKLEAELSIENNNGAKIKMIITEYKKTA